MERRSIEDARRAIDAAIAAQDLEGYLTAKRAELAALNVETPEDRRRLLVMIYEATIHINTLLMEMLRQ